jgi:hypothetical protein
MPKSKNLNVSDKRQKKAAALQLFVQATGRKKPGKSLDPNDRNVDRRTTEAVRHMHPEEFDELLHGGED